MAKQDLVKIIPKAKPVISKPINFLFWLSVVILIILVVLCLFFNSKNSSLETRRDDLEEQLLISQAKTDLEKELISLSEKIKYFSLLLDKHNFTSELFELLSSSCHKKLKINSLQVDNRENKVILSGETESFKSLGEQLLIFIQSQYIKGLSVSNIFLNKQGRVEFNLTFAFSKDLIKK